MRVTTLVILPLQYPLALFLGLIGDFRSPFSARVDDPRDQVTLSELPSPVKASPLEPAASHYQVGLDLRLRGFITCERLNGFHEPPGVRLQKALQFEVRPVDVIV